MKSLNTLIILMLSLNIWSQCPDKNAVDYKNLADKYPNKARYQLLADYHAKKCLCVNGSTNPNSTKDELNAVIEQLNQTGKTHLPKAIRCLAENETEPNNYIEWNGKEESFSKVIFIGNMDSSIPNQIRLENYDADGRLVKEGKKMQYIRISGFQKLEYMNEIKLNEENGLVHVGIIDIENDHYYYTAKKATLIGLGDNHYKLNVKFHFTGSAGNNFQDHPNSAYPTEYDLTAYFEFNPIFEIF